MSEALFLRLLSYEDKAAVLTEAITATHEGRLIVSLNHSVDPDSFEQIPGSPFAYWVSERIRRLFSELPPFEGEGRTAKQGLTTADDFRFVRTWWETSPDKVVSGTTKTTPEEFRQQTFWGKQWIPLAKGGAYSPYYSDVHLVVNWERDGEEVKSWICQRYDYLNGKWEWVAKNSEYYFKPGLSWPRRTTSGISIRCLPSGSIFGDKGTAAFMRDKAAWLGILQSLPFESMVGLQLAAADAAARSYEAGLIQRTPVPRVSPSDLTRLAALTGPCVQLKRKLDTKNEISHIFNLPPLLHLNKITLAERSTLWYSEVKQSQSQVAGYQQEINNIAFDLYGIEGTDRQAMEATLAVDEWSARGEENEAGSFAEDIEPVAVDHRQLTADLLSYFVGCAFGRWDVRYATGEQNAPELPDAFAPLPVCAPGALTGSDGLPARKAPPNYPLRIDWDGIIVDHPNHDDDVIHRVREVFELIWQKKAEEIEREACELLDVKTLRDYFRKPAAGGFWLDHVKRYSKSRRKAPIYWLLRSSKGNYAIWLYYHRLDKDILFKALLNYVEPRLRLEENNLAQLNQRRQIVGTSGREAKQLEKELDKQESYLSELYDFRDKLKRAADLNLEPDLNDGVILNIAPLWELVPWKEAEKYWKELLHGKYEWSSIAKQLRQRGIMQA